ncbi:MAG: HD domain-containing protein [Deltaproteobacteria bacterium]|nr:HD domain-containing protein [Deltaproteobacteria bacterium]
MSDASAVCDRLTAALAVARMAWAEGAQEPREEAAIQGEETASPLDAAALWVDHAFGQVSKGAPISIRPLRRSIVDMLFVGVDADELWMDVIRASDFAKHAARVARLALLVSEGIGLSAQDRQELGVAALLHDVGYGARSLAPEQSSPFAGHVRTGLLALAPRGGATQGLVWRGLVALYHHHPASTLSETPSLPARIIRLAEDYDHLCHHAKAPHSPWRALALMAGSGGSLYDATLLQAMINALGCYPPGTCLQLRDGRICWSASVAREGLFDRPRAFCADGSSLDLAEDGVVARVMEP